MTKNKTSKQNKVSTVDAATSTIHIRTLDTMDNGSSNNVINRLSNTSISNISNNNSSPSKLKTLS